MQKKQSQTAHNVQSRRIKVVTNVYLFDIQIGIDEIDELLEKISAKLEKLQALIEAV